MFCSVTVEWKNGRKGREGEGKESSKRRERKERGRGGGRKRKGRRQTKERMGERTVVTKNIYSELTHVQNVLDYICHKT